MEGKEGRGDGGEERMGKEERGGAEEFGLIERADLYLKLMKEGKVTGTIFPQQNYIPEDSKYAAFVKK